MGVARDLTPLPAIVTDADWHVAFQFYGLSLEDPATLADGSTWSLVLAPSNKRQPAAGEVHEFTGDGVFALTDGYRLTVDVPATAFDDWVPGVYVAELRQTEGGHVRGLYLGVVTVFRGLSDLVARGGGGALPEGSGADLRVVSAAGNVYPYPDVPGAVPSPWLTPALDFSFADNFALGLMTGVF